MNEFDVELMNLLARNSLRTIKSGEAYRVSVKTRTQVLRLVEEGYVKILRDRVKGYYKLTKKGREALVNLKDLRIFLRDFT